jgi:cytidylate kinase
MAIITISRGTFSGGKMLAEHLAERLGYRCEGREEILATASKRYGVSQEKLLEAILRRPSAFRRFTYEREQYLAYIQAILCEHARADNLVYHGNAGHFLLKGVSHVLRVRIVAPMELRVRFVMERQQMLRDEVIKHIEKVDKQRIKWTKFLYGADWRSPELYDIVFNLETENILFISNMIEHAIQEEPFRTTLQSQKAMDNLALSSLVRAAVFSNSDTRDVNIMVEAEEGVVTIVGKAKRQDAIEMVENVVRNVPGVRELKNQVVLDYRYQRIET